MVRTHHFILLSTTTLCKKWLAIIASEVQNRNKILKEKEMKYCLRTHYPWVLQVYIDDGPNFPQQNSLVLQKIVADVDKVVIFKDS